jgi:hypothetical protein
VVRKEIQVVGEQNRAAARPLAAADMAALAKKLKPPQSEPISAV